MQLLEYECYAFDWEKFLPLSWSLVGRGSSMISVFVRTAIALIVVVLVSQISMPVVAQAQSADGYMDARAWPTVSRMCRAPGGLDLRWTKSTRIPACRVGRRASEQD